MIMSNMKKFSEETERERLMKLRSFVYQNRLKGMGKEKVAETVEQVNELNRGGTLSRYINKTRNNPDRKAGNALALKKKWGDKNYGLEEPKVKGMDRNEEVKQVDEIDYKKYLKVSQEKRPFTMRTVDAAVKTDKEGNPNPLRKLQNTNAARKFAQGRLTKKFNASQPARPFPVYEPGRTYVGDSVELNGPIIDEARRMSAAEKLGRAFDSEQQKSADSRRRAQEYMTKIRADVDAKMKKDKEGMKEQVEIPDDITKKLTKITKQLHKSVSAHGRQRDILMNLIKKDKEGMKEEAEQVNEILPMLGAMAGRAMFSRSRPLIRRVASMTGQAAGSAAQRGLDAKMKKDKEGMKEEADQVDELNKSTLASYAKKATDDVSYHSFMAGGMSAKNPERLAQDKKAMKRQTGVIKAIDRLTKEEVELDEMSPEARKNKMRTMGVNAAIQHPKKMEFAGGAIQMYRQAVKNLSSKEMSNMAKKLPSVKEENDGTEADEGEYGYEGDMAMSQLKSIIRNAKSLHDLLEPQTDLPEWVQSKITLASDYIQTAADYWRSEKEGMDESMGDPAKEKAERLFGGPVKTKSSVIGGKGQPTNLRNLTSRLATKAMKAGMKAGKSMSEEKLNMYRNMANKK